MNRKGVLSEPRGPRPDSQETSPLLTAYYTGGSGDGAALHRNKQDGKNIVHRISLHILSEHLMQEITGRRVITSLKTNDN